MTTNEFRQKVKESNLDEWGADYRLNESIKELIIYCGHLVACNDNETDILIARNDVIRAANDVALLKAIRKEKRHVII